MDNKSVYELRCVWDISTHIYLHPLLNPALLPSLSLRAQGWNLFLFHLLWRSIFSQQPKKTTDKFPLQFPVGFPRTDPAFGVAVLADAWKLPFLSLDCKLETEFHLWPKETLVPSTSSLIRSLWHKSEFTPVLGCCECNPQKRKTLLFLDESKTKQN